MQQQQHQQHAAKKMGEFGIGQETYVVLGVGRVIEFLGRGAKAW